jgi:membrane fusion protein (multidrug efflux system)
MPGPTLPLQRFALAAVVIFSSAVVLSGCDAGASSSEPVESTEVEAALPVETTEVRPGDVAATYEATATLEPERQAQVVAKQAGILIELLVEEGEYVEQGQLLARLEQDQYALQLQQIEASLRQLENELRRADELHQRRLISADQYERIQASAEGQRAAHALARLDLANTEIRAPIAGVVSTRMVKLGNLITQHQPLFVIADFDSLWAVMHVPERQLDMLQPGQAARLQADAFPGSVFEGEVLRISPVIDAETGTLAVTTRFSGADGRLRPGVFGRIQVVHDQRRGVPLIPEEAILNEDGRQAVFVLVGDAGADGTRRVERRAIRTGYHEASRVEVVEGLDEGDTVVTAGKNSLRDGARVKVIPS